MISKTFAVRFEKWCSSASVKRRIHLCANHLRFTEAQLQREFSARVPALCALMVLISANAFAGVAATETDIKKARDMIYPATVRVDVRSSVFADGQRRWVRGTGSGFIYDKEGHVVTNYHVAGLRDV
jgi:S1-C subfamily serine protease